MSDSKNKKHLGYEVLALALFLGGAFLAVSAVMSLREGGGIPQNPTTQTVTALMGFMGLVPFLGTSMGALGLGAIMFLRPAVLPVRVPGGLMLAYSLAGALLLGVFGDAWGGSLGAFLPGLLGSVGGGIAGVLCSFTVAVLGSWLALGMPALRKSKKPGELNSVAAALREEEVDGVSNAEAEALFPEEVQPTAKAPGVREYELRSRGELPEGVKPLARDEDLIHEEVAPQSLLHVADREVRVAPLARPAKPTGADLAAAEAAEVDSSVRPIEGGVWVRDAEEAGLEASPLVPSWEAAALEGEAEALQPTDSLAEDGERFDEFEVDVPLEPVGEHATDLPAFVDPEVVAAFDDETEDEAAELDENKEDEDEEDEATELDEDEEEYEEQTLALEELFDGEDAAPELEEEEEEPAPSRAAAQPGLFDGHDEEPVGLPTVELKPKRSAPQPAPEPEVAVEKPAAALTHEELVYQSGIVFLEADRVAVSMLQRRFDLAFSEATVVLDDLQSMGLIGPYAGGSHREILMTLEEWKSSSTTK